MLDKESTMRNLIISSLFLFLPLSVLANTNLQKDVDRLFELSQKSNLGYEIVESLTTQVGARPGGSEAEKRARDWAVKQFKKLGLRNIQIEPFPVHHWKRISESAEITRPFPQKLEITALGGSISTPKEGIEGEVIRFESLDELIESPIKDLSGKIVFVDEWMTRTQDGSGYGVAVRKRGGAAREAGKRNALAALIRSVGTHHHRFPHTGIMGYHDKFKKVPTAALSAPDADQLTRALSYGKTVVRLNLQIENHGENESGNVIAEVPGKKKDEVILLGAHLDSWDLGTGAVDDGAGVGIVMAAANLIKKLGKKPKRTIRVILFGSEEVGLIGAKAYVKKHEKRINEIVVAAESDFGAGKIYKLDSRFSKSSKEKRKDILKYLRHLRIMDGDNEAHPGPDLYPFKAMGVPYVDLSQNGWDYFDLHHTADDTFDKIEPENIRQNVAAYATFAWVVANMDQSFR